ncbi:MAG: ribosome-binding factor A, partial [Thermotogaceae bacterium]|nr:ribosome-binding factor A [Thermotogaceae bacterium]
CIGGDKEKVIEILGHAKGYFRTYVAKNLKLFTAPEIRFREDKGIESSVRVHKLLVEMGYDPLKEEEEEQE